VLYGEHFYFILHVSGLHHTLIRSSFLLQLHSIRISSTTTQQRACFPHAAAALPAAAPPRLVRGPRRLEADEQPEEGALRCPTATQLSRVGEPRKEVLLPRDRRSPVLGASRAVPARGRLDVGEGCATAGGGVLPRDRTLRRPRHLLLPPRCAEELWAADTQLDLRLGPPPLPLIFVCLSLQVFFWMFQCLILHVAKVNLRC
jgi:hypothetical protein